MEVRFELCNCLQAIHFSDVLLSNGLSFRVISPVEKSKDDDNSIYINSNFIFYVTVPIDD